MMLATKLNEKSVLAYVIESLAFELNLTPEQKTELAEILIPAAEDSVILDRVQSHYEPYLIRFYASKVSIGKMKKLLSDSQLQQWKIYVGPAKNFGPMFEMAENEDEVVRQPDFATVLANVVEDVAEGMAESIEDAVEFLIQSAKKK